MSPNPIALEISRNTTRSYDEVRRALNTLEANGWNVAQASKFVSDVAKTGTDVLEAARVAVATQSPSVGAQA